MHGTMRFGPEDRDERGFVRVRPPAETLPPLPEGPPALVEPDAPPAPATPAAPRRRGSLALTRQQQLTALGIAGGLALALGLIVAIGALAPAGPRIAPPAPPTVPATPPPSPAPPTAIPAIAAFWAPGGDRAPDLAASTPFTPTARYGDTWVSVEVPGGGQVWIGRGDAGARGARLDALPDLSAPSPSSPAAAPASPAGAPAGCALPDRPSHTSTRQVLRGAVPIGQVTGVGCSQAEADANAAQLAAAMLGGH